MQTYKRRICASFMALLLFFSALSLDLKVFAESDAAAMEEESCDLETSKSGEAGYISCLHIGPNVSHQGPVRKYTKDYFKIVLEDVYGLDFTEKDTLSLRTRLYRQNFITSTLTTVRTAYFTSNYQTKTNYHGNQGAGRYYWDFLADYTSGFDSDTVLLQSYNIG